MNLNWNNQNALALLSATVVAAIAVTALYWAKMVFIPIALAIYLTFLLSIPANYLQHHGARRGLAVGIVAFGSLLLIAGFGWLIFEQMNEFVKELPGYRGNLEAKARQLREMTEGGPLAELERLMEDISEDVFPQKEQPARPAELPLTQTQREEKKAVRVIVKAPEGESWPGRLQVVATALFEPLAEAILTGVLVLFMLLKQEDVRNRVIRLLGPDRVTATTRVILDTESRIARFLWTQFLINFCYGLVVAIGLAVIGVNYSLLWGFVAGLSRYVPYIGAWIGALFPLAVSVVIFPDWLPLLFIFGLFVVLEVCTGNFIEPILFGHSIGVSEIALLVSAGVWTFLWGPIGLLLSGPITVCMVVASRHVPQLWVLDVLLGDAPPLPPATSYYQRLLAQDQDEAADIVQAYLKEHPGDDIYDGLFVPALSLAKRDRDRGELPADREAFILQATREIIDSMTPDREEAELDAAHNGAPRPLLLACPARDDEDHLALEMLEQVLDGSKWQLEIVPVEALAVELLQIVAREKPALVFIGSLAPGGLTHTRYLCKRLRARFPDLKVIVGRWGATASDATSVPGPRTGCDEITGTLRATRRWLDDWRPALTHEDATRMAQSATV